MRHNLYTVQLCLRVWIFNVLILLVLWHGRFSFQALPFCPLFRSLPTHHAPLLFTGWPSLTGYLGNLCTLASLPFQSKHPPLHKLFLFFSSSFMTLVFVPRPFHDLVCHRCSLLPSNLPASLGWLVGLGFVDSWVCLSQ